MVGERVQRHPYKKIRQKPVDTVCTEIWRKLGVRVIHGHKPLEAININVRFQKDNIEPTLLLVI